MEHALEELSKRDDLVQVLALVIAIIFGVIVFWIMRILFQMVKNMGSGTDKSMTVIEQLAVNSTTNQQAIVQQLHQSSQSLQQAIKQINALDSRVMARQDEQQQVMASITLVLDTLQKRTAQDDAALRAEIDQHETKAIERSNENLEVAQRILLEVATFPERLDQLEAQHDKIIATIGRIEDKQKVDNDHLKRIEKSVLDAIKSGDQNRSTMIQQVLDRLQVMMNTLKALQEKPSEVVAVFAGNTGGESA